MAFRASDRGGTRTLDQRINVPHRLSPTVVTSIEARLRSASSRSRVEGLDYPIAIAGVPRLVSEAEAGPATGPLPADYPIRSLFRPSRLPLPATLWCKRLSGRSSILRHSLVAVPLLPARGSYFDFSLSLKSVALPTELPGRQCHLNIKPLATPSVQTPPRTRRSRMTSIPVRRLAAAEKSHRLRQRS